MAATINASTSSGIVTSADNSGQLELQTANTTRLTINSSGDVGIGTTSPSYKLDIASGVPLRVASPVGNAAGFEFCGNGNTYGTTSMFVGQGSASIAFVYQRANEAMAFGTNNTERMRIDSSGNVGIGTASPNGDGTALHINGSSFATLHLTNGTTGTSISDGFDIVMDGSDVLLRNRESAAMKFATASTERMRITSAGNVGIGVTPAGTGLLELAAGTTTVAPLEFNAGSLLSSPVAGTFEYASNLSYFTNDTRSGRGYIPATQIFRLTSNGAAIGPSINNFFGANSALDIANGGVYEVEAYCRFTKTTLGVVTVTITTSAAPANLSGTVDYGAAAGGTATGAANRISLYNSTSTAAAFGGSAALTTGANHTFIIKLLVEAGNAGNIRINFTSSAGTVTPLRTSYYKVTQLPGTNVGTYVA